MVHDNAPYHTESTVSEKVKKLGIHEVPIIPYSPQLNEPAECCFGFTKQRVAALKFVNHVNQESIYQSGITKWKEQLQYYNAKQTAVYFNVWLEILKECSEGHELIDKKYPIEDIDLQYLRQYKTIRIK